MAAGDVTHTLVRLDGVTARQVNQNFRDVTEFVNGQTVHRDGTGLADAFTAAGQWQSWTPVLTAATTNPTLGTGSSQTGRFMCLGTLVVGHGRIAFGTTGVLAGNGQYRVSLPIPCATSGVVVGSMMAQDTSNLTASRGGVMISGPTSTTTTSQTVAGITANNVPFAWAATDIFTFTFMYEAA